jgi:hypothetical protein
MCAQPETLQILMTATTADQVFNALSSAEQALERYKVSNSGNNPNPTPYGA